MTNENEEKRTERSEVQKIMSEKTSTIVHVEEPFSERDGLTITIAKRRNSRDENTMSTKAINELLDRALNLIATKCDIQQELKQLTQTLSPYMRGAIVRPTGTLEYIQPKASRHLNHKRLRQELEKYGVKEGEMDKVLVDIFDQKPSHGYLRAYPPTSSTRDLSRQ